MFTLTLASFERYYGKCIPNKLKSSEGDSNILLGKEEVFGTS